MGFCIFWGVVNVLSVLLPLPRLLSLAAGRGLCRQGLSFAALMLFGAEQAMAQSSQLPGGSGIVFQVLAMLDAWMPALLVTWLLAGALVWRWLPRRQTAVLYAAKQSVGMPLSVAAGCLLVFAMLAWVVVYPEHAGHARLMAADAGAQQWAQDHVSAPVREVLHVLTAAGDVRWLVVMVLLVAGWLALGAQWHALWAWVFFIGLNGLAVRLLKNLLDRARPEVLHEMLTSGASFPSGHTSGAVVVYGLLWLVLRGRLSPAASRALAWVCAVLVAIIALSRILLQAHFASDVLAGALLGLAWCALAALVLGRGGRQN